MADSWRGGQALQLLEEALSLRSEPFRVALSANSSWKTPELFENGTTCLPDSSMAEGGNVEFLGDVDNATLSLVQVAGGGGGGGDGSEYVPTTIEEFCTRQSSKVDEFLIRVTVELNCEWPDMLEGAGLGGEAELQIVGDCPPGQRGDPDVKMSVREAAVVDFRSLYVKN